jgi:hypothetical protein
MKNKTYLERNDGKRLFLTTYVPPAVMDLVPDLYFNGSSTAIPSSHRIRKTFGSMRSSSDALKLNMKFKVTEMMYNGQLEY